MCNTLPTSQPLKDRLARLQEIARLGRLGYTPEGLSRFLTTPLSEFDGRTALQLIELGETERVLAVVSAGVV